MLALAIVLREQFEYMYQFRNILLFYEKKEWYREERQEGGFRGLTLHHSTEQEAWSQLCVRVAVVWEGRGAVSTPTVRKKERETSGLTWEIFRPGSWGWKSSSGRRGLKDEICNFWLRQLALHSPRKERWKWPFKAGGRRWKDQVGQKTFKPMSNICTSMSNEQFLSWSA